MAFGNLDLERHKAEVVSVRSIGYVSPHYGDPMPDLNKQHTLKWLPDFYQHQSLPMPKTEQSPRQLCKDGSVMIDGNRFKFEGGQWVLIAS